MSASTRGPWKAQRVGGWVVKGPDGKSICAYASNGTRPPKEAAANMAAIAQTPDAMTLLKVLVKWHDRTDQDDGDDYLNGDLEDGSNGWNDIDKIADAARAVLAAAGVELPEKLHAPHTHAWLDDGTCELCGERQ